MNKIKFNPLFIIIFYCIAGSATMFLLEKILAIAFSGVAIHHSWISIPTLFLILYWIVTNNIREKTSQNKSFETLMKNKQELEKKLSLSDSNYKTLVEFSPDAIGILTQGQWVYVNSGFVRLTGANFESDILGRNVNEILPDVDINLLSEVLPHSILDQRCLKPDGQLYDVEISINHCLYNGNVSTQFVLRDITKRKIIERELKKSQQLFSKAFVNSPVAMSISTLKDGIFLDVNTSFGELLGYSVEEIIGKTSVDMKLFEDTAARERIGKEVFGSGNTKNIESVVFDRNNKQHNILTSVELLEIDNEVCLLSLIVDISERKTAEEELNTFLYRASHDLKGPLTTILGLVNVAQSDNKDHPSFKYFEMINITARRLIIRLLSLKEIVEIKRNVPKFALINFEDIIHDVQKKLNSTPGFHEATFNIDIRMQGAYYSDPGFILPVFYHIIDNAIKYKLSDVGNTEISIRVNDMMEKYLYIEIEDKGAGIKEEISKNIFEMFYKGTNLSQGPGLGLYIVSKALEKIKGKISFESKEGHGTKFKIFLPNHSKFELMENVGHSGNTMAI